MFKAIFTNSFGILFSRILGFIRDLLTASFLGANIYSDIFFVAFKLPNLFRRIFAEGAFSQTFIPSFARSRHKGAFLAYIFTLFLSIILFITLLVDLFPSIATRAIAIGFDTKTIELATPYVAINFWYLPLIFSVTFIAALLQYKHHFATTAFGTSLLNLSLIGALLLAKGMKAEVIVTYLSFGVVIGGLLQLLAHLIALKKLGLCRIVLGGFIHLQEKKSKIKEDVTKFKQEFFPAIWGNSTAQLSAFLDTWLASFLSAGAISYLYYANRVFQLPLALFAIATSVAIFPKVSRYLKNSDTAKAKSYMERAFWFLAYLLTFSSIVGIVLSDEIVWLLFEHGAFDATDAKNTALVLQMYLLGLLPYGLGKLFSLWLYASQRQLDAAKIASFSLGSNILFSLALIAPFGAAGLALASTIAGFVSFGLTLRTFGVYDFLLYLRSKHTLLLLIGVIVLAIITLMFKSFIDQYI